MFYEDLLLNEDVKFKDDKRRVNEDGYYALYICDFEKGSRKFLESINLPEGKIVCIGKFKDGKMYDYITDIPLDYVDDVNVIFDAGEEFYYFEKPCYVNYEKISPYTVAIIMSRLRNENDVKAYFEVLSEQIKQAVSGYECMKEFIEHYGNGKIKRKN